MLDVLQQFADQIWLFIEGISGWRPGDETKNILEWIAAITGAAGGVWGLLAFFSGGGAATRKDVRDLKAEAATKADIEDIKSRFASLEEKLAARAAAKQERLPGPDAGERRAQPDIAQDLGAAIQTLAQAGKTRALELLDQGDRGAADKVLADKIAEIETARDRAAREEAALYRQRGALAFLDDTAEALRFYAKAAELDPDEGEGWWHLGQLQMRAGYLPAAKASFERLLALGNRFPNPQMLHWTHMLLDDVETALGNHSAALDQYERACALIQTLSQKDPANAQWQTDLIISAYKLASLGGPEACRHAQEGLAIAKRLAAEGKLAADQPYIAVMEALVAQTCG